MDKAVQLALAKAKNSHCLFVHGAVLIKNNEIITSDFNKSVSCNWKNTIHAEEAILRRLPLSITQNSILVVVSISYQNGQVRISKPCSKCSEYIIKKRVARVYYSV